MVEQAMGCEDLSLMQMQGKGLSALKHSIVMHICYYHVSEHVLRILYMSVIADDHLSVKPTVTCLMAVLSSARSLSIKCSQPRLC